MRVLVGMIAFFLSNVAVAQDRMPVDASLVDLALNSALPTMPASVRSCLTRDVVRRLPDTTTEAEFQAVLLESMVKRCGALGELVTLSMSEGLGQPLAPSTDRCLRKAARRDPTVRRIFGVIVAGGEPTEADNTALGLAMLRCCTPDEAVKAAAMATD